MKNWPWMSFRAFLMLGKFIKWWVVCLVSFVLFSVPPPSSPHIQSDCASLITQPLLIVTRVRTNSPGCTTFCFEVTAASVFWVFFVCVFCLCVCPLKFSRLGWLFISERERERERERECVFYVWVFFCLVNMYWGVRWFSLDEYFFFYDLWQQFSVKN